MEQNSEYTPENENENRLPDAEKQNDGPAPAERPYYYASQEQLRAYSTGSAYGTEAWDTRPVKLVKQTRVWPIVLTAVLTCGLTLLLSLALFSGQRARPADGKPGSSSTESTQPGTVIPGSLRPERPAESDSQWEQKLSEIKEYVDAYYIGEVDEGKLADAMAAGLIEGLGDEWSYYIPAEEYASYLESVTNSYVGIGVTISAENVDKGIEIVDVTPDSPAYHAGLEIGDLILAVEGVPILDGSEGAIDLNETKNRVRGAEGTDGQPPLYFCLSLMSLKALVCWLRMVFTSKSVAMRLRCSVSLLASSTHGVSCSMMAFRSWSFSSCESRASGVSICHFLM